MTNVKKYEINLILFSNFFRGFCYKCKQIVTSKTNNMKTSTILLQSIPAKIACTARSVWKFYYEGFTSMTVGKSLWTLILIKVILIMGIMKFLFFPNILHRDYTTDEERADHVRKELTSHRIFTPHP